MSKKHSDIEIMISDCDNADNVLVSAVVICRSAIPTEL